MICLSFDTDHMSDERMHEFLAAVEIPGDATFFCTQAYAALQRGRHESCPHPFLGKSEDWAAELGAKRKEFPKAVGWRSHSCVFSHILAEDVVRLGYRYVSTQDEIGRPGITPHRHCWGVWQMPIYYMDNLDFSFGRFWTVDGFKPFDRSLIDTALDVEGVYVFDFHPIHLLINSDSAETYFARRDAFKRGEPIETLKFEGYGVRHFFEELCERMLQRGVESLTMSNALDIFEARLSK